MLIEKNIHFYDNEPQIGNLKEDILSGLTNRPKMILPKYFYDQRGSELFDEICELPEYYPTRTETALLRQHADGIAQLVGTQSMLIELGSGASKKVRLLLNALKPANYMAMDISKEFLLQSSSKLAADYPWLEVHATCADFSQSITLPNQFNTIKKLAFFPGSSIGNFEPQEAILLLKRIYNMLQPNGALLIGVDLKKDINILSAAYNDQAGITAQFNLNILNRINNELDSNINIDHFSHNAFYNPSQGRIEMHLVSNIAQDICVENNYIHFDKGESIHTENSYKYSIEEFQHLAQLAGFTPTHNWTDHSQLFSMHLLTIDPN